MPQENRLGRLLSKLLLFRHILDGSSDPESMDAMIRSAIKEKRMLEFCYKGSFRVVEPHVYGNKGGEDGIMAYQVRGESSSGKPEGWKRMYLKDVTGIKILDEKFPGRRPTKNHSEWDVIYCIVDVQKLRLVFLAFYQIFFKNKADLGSGKI